MDARTSRVSFLAWWLCVVVTAGPVESASGQEVVGRRLFSDQLVIAEPFVEDELALPSILHTRRRTTDDSPATRATQISAELKKRLTRNLEGSVAVSLTHSSPDAKSSVTGFDNLELGLKYQFIRDPMRELVASAAVRWEIGGTGRAATGAESFDVVTPALLVGKGFGDLPEALAGFRPFALVGALGIGIPSRARHPNTLRLGAVVEYSLPYLDSVVKDLGLAPPLNRMVPLTEIDLQTSLDRGARGTTVGTANPGVVWIGTRIQIGVEAVIPVNELSGKGVGVRAFVRFDLEAIFGERLGRPLFGEMK